jgi:hypothetical protein
MDDQSRLIEAVRAWQADPRGRPVLCREDRSHAPLVPVSTPQGVILRCRDCGYVQTTIPPMALSRD